MTGTIYEFFGYRSADRSEKARHAVAASICDVLGTECEKTLSDGTISGACAIKPATSGPVICCPIRLYADNYRILRDIADSAFSPGLQLVPGAAAISAAKQSCEPTIAVFGKKWGGEIRLPKRFGTGSYFVDWILALIDAEGMLVEFVAVEVQSIDTTGSYRASRSALLGDDSQIVTSTVGLNWENVNKRIIPQLIYKGQVLQRESLCKKGLFFVCPQPVYERILDRVGGISSLPEFPLQPASITLLAYNYDTSQVSADGEVLPLVQTAWHSTSVVKFQEAFSNINLPDADVYKEAIEHALGMTRFESEGGLVAKAARHIDMTFVSD